MSNQSDLQQAVRTRHAQSGSRDYNSDWHELFDQESIDPGDFNARLLTWINVELVADGDTAAPYADLPGAMQAYAARAGAYNWSSLNTLL